MSNQSLVSKNEGGALAVLGAYEPEQTQLAPSAYSGAVYVQFAHPKAKNYAALIQAYPDLEESDPFLIQPDPARPIKLNPFTFLLLRQFQHFADVDNNGQIIKTYDEPGSGRKEHIETAILAYHNGELTPATCTFKTTKAAAAKTAIKTLELAADTEKWGRNSPDHNATIAIPDPRFRFTTTVKLRPSVGQSSGNAYVAATGLCRPTTVADWQVIGSKLNDPKFTAAMAAVLKAFDGRRRFVNSKRAAS